MKKIPVTEFKAHCTQILREVADTPYTVTKRGKPIAIITPVKEKDGKKPKTIEDFMGCMRGSSVEIGDIVAPLDEEWNASK
jgi:prevent-host-death family protein